MRLNNTLLKTGFSGMCKSQSGSININVGLTLAEVRYLLVAGGAIPLPSRGTCVGSSLGLAGV